MVTMPVGTGGWVDPLAPPSGSHGRNTEQRLIMTELVKQMMRQQEHFEVPVEQLRAASAGMGGATLGVERAFRIGALTIVDAPCWEAMGAAYFAFDELRSAMRAGGATEMQALEEVDQYIGAIAGHASRFNKGVSDLMPAANDRVSPAETWWNRRRRRRARRRLGELYQRMHAVDTPDEAPQPHD